MNRNCRRKTEKVYVKVNSDFDATAICSPGRSHGAMVGRIPSSRCGTFALQIPLPICPATVIL